MSRERYAEVKKLEERLDELLENTARHAYAYFLNDATRYVLKKFAHIPETLDLKVRYLHTQERFPELKKNGLEIDEEEVKDVALVEDPFTLTPGWYDFLFERYKQTSPRDVENAFRMPLGRTGPYQEEFYSPEQCVDFVNGSLKQIPDASFKFDIDNEFMKLLIYEDIDKNFMKLLIYDDISRGLSEEEFQHNLFQLSERIIDDDKIRFRTDYALFEGHLDSWDELFECLEFSSTERFLGVLGSGLNGTTYLAYSPSFKKNVAIKIINANTNTVREYEGLLDDADPADIEDPDDLDLLEDIAILHMELGKEDLDSYELHDGIERKKSYDNEIQTLIELHHENIVHIYYAGDHFVKKNDEPVYAIMMEYVDGPTLDELIQNRPEDMDVFPAIEHGLQMCDYGLQMLEGIEYLIKKGIFHKDIHPKNVGVNSQGILKIMDFGTAGALGEENERRCYGGQNDLFSWGLLMYEMLSGEHLVAQRKQGEDTEHYASRVAMYREKMMTETGELSPEYKQKIFAGVYSMYAEPIIQSLEANSGENLEDIKKQMTELYQSYQKLIASTKQKSAELTY